MSILLCGQIYCQEPKEIIILPGEGILFEGDTIILGINPKTLLTKIDTIKNAVTTNYTTGHSNGFILITDSLTGQTTTKDIYWTTYYCDIIFSEFPVYFMFEGDSVTNLLLNKIKIEYPCKAITTNGLKTGSYYTDIFVKYNRKEGSYNCGENGFYYCYSNHGISFGVKPYNENPNPEMFEKIINFEIYEKQNNKRNSSNLKE